MQKWMPKLVAVIGTASIDGWWLHRIRLEGNKLDKLAIFLIKRFIKLYFNNVFVI